MSKTWQGQNCFWIGTLLDDVNFKYTDDGKPNAFIRLEVPTGGKTDDGKPRSDWLSFTAWDDAAVNASKGNKGDEVIIRGYVKPYKEEGALKDGKPLYGYRLNARDVWVVPSETPTEE